MSLVEGELDLHVLTEIYLAGVTYTYAIYKALKNREYRIETNLPTLYAVMDRLEKAGHIERLIVPAIPTARTGKPSKRECKYFHITTSGVAVLPLRAAKWRSTVCRIEESLTRADKRGESREVL